MVRPTIILGGGLAGLSAGVVLTRAGRPALVLERGADVGGLARTVAHGAFRFDLGGHRFYTQNGRVDAFLREVLGAELVAVRRRSKILLGGRYFDYPLKPLNALGGLGVRGTARMLFDYAAERVKSRLRPPRMVSLEDWVVSRFGRAMFDAYFKEYSEKVWGIGCDRICMEWVEQRIQGLSLGRAITGALFKWPGAGRPTLAETFLYPSLGIGRVAERLREEIERENRVLTDAGVARLEHRRFRVQRLTAEVAGRAVALEGDEFVSTIPLPSLVRMLRPRAPAEVLHAASRLRFRDLVVVAVMVNRERVTDLTWLYVPERGIPFGRIHEPTNWSARMAPPGKTLLVAEHFCFRGDATWAAADEQLVELTVAHLVRLGCLARREVRGGAVCRVPGAYPLFEVGYREHLATVCEYLGRFRNLRLTGRGGTFQYMNMDHAIASGIAAAEGLLQAEGAFVGGAVA